ncbi:VOC family protein [Rhizobium sp. CFBP 8762]|uniref:VOC family protein n=1 Tax=Rhizobium sp. CFBP 8762 TaxID=2775279 RepID=UPI001784163D|nr:VOC family protein [Rhizobium sp. CFBP 8762]MBD8552982.1 VOC family protein [Rhizobium sp. CFBP 8762]
MPIDRRVSLITLGVSDVSVSTAFYERLGWVKSSASQDAITFIQLKGTVLALFSRSALADDAGVTNTETGFSGVTLAHNLGSEAAVDDTFAEFVRSGAQPVKPPHKVFWGGYSSYVADPDGHLWEIAYNPFVPMDDDGHLVLPE